MKIEKRGSGSYRVRKTYNKKTYTMTFAEKPTQKDIMAKLAALMENEGIGNDTMRSYINKYIDSKRNVLSPSTIITYERLINVMSDDFLKIRLDKLTQLDVQEEINRYAKDHSPKSVKSLHGFIASVLGLFRPQMVLRTSLPQTIQKDKYTPTSEDIKALLDYTQGTDDHIAFHLGVLSLRRGEICALELSDLEGNELHVHATMVWNRGWIKKESPKTDAGNRIVYLPPALADEIRSKGYFFPYSPNKLLEHLHKYQKELGLPQFKFHDLRHFFASYASTIMPESEAMALGGWKSDRIFKNIYREAYEDNKKKAANLFNQSLFS